MSDLNLSSPRKNKSGFQKAQRLRIYLSEGDRWRGKPLYAALLDTLRGIGMAGATVMRGTAGFGAASHLHSASLEVLAMDLPVVMDVVDTPQKISTALEAIYPMVREGLITLEDVQMVKYTHRFLNPLPADRLVSEAMTRDVVTVKPEMNIYQVWKQMLEKAVKAMPVIDEAGKVVGIVTDEDLLERAGIQQRLSIAIRMDPAEIRQELDRLKSSPLHVSDVMTHPAITVEEKDTLGAATALLVRAGLKRLPVVHSDGKLAGLLSRLDILRQVANTPHELPPAAYLPKGAVRTVQDVMTSDIPMVHQDDDLATVVENFSKSDSYRLIVVDAAGKAIGLISDSDVVARIQSVRRSSILEALRRAGKPPAGKETAFDLMSPGVCTAPPDFPVVEAAKKMLAEARKWLVVVDDNDKPLGLVDRQILLESLTTFYRP